MHDDRRAPEGRPSGRDDRGQAPRGGAPRRDDRGPRGPRRDDRGPRGPRRDDDCRGGFRRDDRGPRSEGGRPDRGPRREGDAARDDRRGGGFRRDDRPDREHRPQGPRRDDERSRGTRDDRSPRRDGDAARERRDDRDQRPPRRDDRGPRDRRSDAPARRGHATEARGLALEALLQLRERKAFAQDVITKVVDTSKISREDRAFATRLVLGVTSTRGTLDYVLDGCMDSPDDASPAVRDALALSAYEIIFLQKSPHAAVDQGVELVKSVAPRAGGLANAVLRRVVRAKESFPFGDPRTDLAAYARLHGFPTWLAERLVRELGPQGAHDLMTASNEPAPVFIAVNAAKATDDEVVSVLAAAHGDPQPVDVAGRAVPGCYRLASGLALLDGRVRRMLSQGLLLVSDATSQAVASLVVGDEAPASFLEVGAGRATKTILDQSMARRRFGRQVADYVTVDAHAFKTKLLVERAAQYDVEVAEALTGDGCDLDALVGERAFDRVFVDAPCTGLGTLRRHADIRWRLRPETVAEQAALGGRLLASAAAHVAPGGILAYATCTVLVEENAEVVEAFLASEAGAGFEPIPYVREDLGVELPYFSVALEPGGSDAHFLALLRRVS